MVLLVTQDGGGDHTRGVVGGPNHPPAHRLQRGCAVGFAVCHVRSEVAHSSFRSLGVGAHFRQHDIVAAQRNVRAVRVQVAQLLHLLAGVVQRRALTDGSLSKHRKHTYRRSASGIAAQRQRLHKTQWATHLVVAEPEVVLHREQLIRTRCSHDAFVNSLCHAAAEHEVQDVGVGDRVGRVR